MLDFLLKMSLFQLQNTARYFNLRGFEHFSKNKLIEFLISSVNHKALLQYIEPLIVEDDYLGQLLETELMQQDVEEQFGQMGLTSRSRFSQEPISTGYSRPVGTIHVSSQTLNSLLSGMNIGEAQINRSMIKFRTGKNARVKRLQK
jgi:hypothetical protein